MLVGVQRCASLVGDLCHCFVEPGAGVRVHSCASLTYLLSYLCPAWQRLSSITTTLDPGSASAKLTTLRVSSNLCNGELPRELRDPFASCARGVGLEFARPEQDPDAFAAERVHAVLKWRSPGESGVYEGQDHDWDAKAGRFGEHAEGVGVAYAVGPLVDRVVGGGRNDDRVGPRGPGFAGAAVFAANRSAGLGFELGHVDECQGGWCGDNLDGPAAVVGEFYKPSDFACRSGSAHDHVEDPALAWARHANVPMRAANSLR